MHGHKIRKSPVKFKAPDEIFPGAPPEFVLNMGWGGGKGWDKLPGLSGGTWKYLGNEAYKGVTKGIKGFGKEIESFGKAILKGGKKKFFRK
tara:strand:- start:485 stop:757 length:273 start_codon:yes stop_codon:yes gene_type:complete